MRRALFLAGEAGKRGEVPVGCVITRGGEIVGEGSNRREEGYAAGHAEMEAITAANRRLSAWRLSDCELYVTLEPCPMCAGAIVAARIPKIWFGAYDPKAGACVSVLDLFSYPLNHKPAVSGGHLKEECAGLLRRFFLDQRQTQEGKNHDGP